MLVVKIELHSATTGKVSELGRMIISNDGECSDPKRGNYDVKIGRKGQKTNEEVYFKPQKTAKVENYPRLSYPVWELVKRALQKAL